MAGRYAVLGHPVSHSLSPRIHAAFARQAGIELSYVAIDAPDFDAALAAFDGDGANVTLPHKAAAAAACAGQPLHLALKSGNFGTSDFFTKAFALLASPR